MKIPEDFKEVLRTLKEQGKFPYFKLIVNNTKGLNQFRHHKDGTFYHIPEWLDNNPTRMGTTDKYGNQITVHELLFEKKLINNFRF